MLSLEKSEISGLVMLRKGAVGMDELEKGIAVFWCLRVGFSQQPGCADFTVDVACSQRNCNRNGFLHNHGLSINNP